MFTPLLPCGFGVAQFWFLSLREVNVYPVTVQTSTTIILTTWMTVAFSLSSSLRESSTNVALSESFSNVELSGHTLNSELSISSTFRFGLELGSGVLPAKRAFSCQVITTPVGLVSEDAAFSMSSRPLEFMTGEECVFVSDIAVRQDDDSVKTAAEDGNKLLYHSLTETQVKIDVPARDAEYFHC